MMLKDTVHYRPQGPQPGADGVPKEPNVITFQQIVLCHLLKMDLKYLIACNIVLLGVCYCDNGLCEGCKTSH